MNHLRTVADRVLRGPFAPSEAAVGSTSWLLGLVLGGIAGAAVGWEGVAAVLLGAVLALVALAYRDARARTAHREGRRR